MCIRIPVCPAKFFVDIYNSEAFDKQETRGSLLQRDKGAYPLRKIFWRVRVLMLNSCARLFPGDGTKYNIIDTAWDTAGINETTNDDYDNWPTPYNAELSGEVSGKIDFKGDNDCLRFTAGHGRALYVYA